MKGALDIHRELLARNVAHEIVRLPQVVMSADEVPDVLALARKRCVAVRMYDADGALVAVVVRAGEVPHPELVLRATGAASLRPATSDEVNRATGYAASLVSPLLLPDGVTVLADACIGETDVVYAPTGEGGTVLGIPVRSLLVEARARVAEFCTEDAAVDVRDDDLTAELLGLRAHSWR